MKTDIIVHEHKHQSLFGKVESKSHPMGKENWLQQTKHITSRVPNNTGKSRRSHEL